MIVTKPEAGSVTIPRASGAGATAAVMAGGVLSILTVAVVLAVLPARSAAVPEAVCVAPSVAKEAGALQLATPESASEHAKLTVRFVLFQPKLLAAGVRLAVMAGGVLSTLTFVLGVAVFPATSVAVPGTL